eukprot:TRINITY_DN65784_c0_g1_i1.p1 TRINITY_DN65784_c0_g1~~TRINITY_DN65784_c0_g1_i1.p1  ORF type:complete len:239 (-),score=41.86 TRINITY_DN65784_c0_g1_i1:42-758(-)
MQTNAGVCKNCVASLREIPPLSWISKTDPFQFIMFGLEGAGKTTMLYKLKIPKWKREDIKQDMNYLRKEGVTPARDPAYHYEEMASSYSGSSVRYGIWEIPGNEMMIQMWPLFYRYVRMHAVFFVVDAFSDKRFDLERLARARYWLHFLLNEVELRNAAFIIIINSNTLQRDRKDAKGDVEEKAISEMLGIEEIEKQAIHKGRLVWIACNCADFSRDDPHWENVVLKHIKSVNVLQED